MLHSAEPDAHTWLIVDQGIHNTPHDRTVEHESSFLGLLCDLRLTEAIHDAMQEYSKVEC